MAVDKLVDSTQLDADLTAVADAIRTKGGTSASLAFPTGFVDAIDAIETGGGEMTDEEISAKVLSGAVHTWYSPTSTSIPDSYFYHHSDIETLSLPACTRTGANSCAYCNNMTSVSLPSLVYVGGASGSTSKTRLFWNCTSLTDVWVPKLQVLQDTTFDGCAGLLYLDFPSLATIKANCFRGCSKLATLILRSTAGVVSLGNVNSFSSTPFASGNAGGTIYVPTALISSYQSATNWSTILGYGSGAQNQILPIEGSIYETQYGNGTPIT